MNSYYQGVCTQRTEECRVEWLCDRFHQEALHWHHRWKVDGIPHQGCYTSEMRRLTRARYHQVLKMVKKDNEMIRIDMMAEAVCNDISKDLCEEVWKMNANKRSSPVSVNGMTDDDEVSNVLVMNGKIFITVFHMILITLKVRLKRKLTREYCLIKI